ncbi:MAG: peptidase M48 [Candidatus Melainabacteria bacterium HGW-Melainabacteria-1]|nr:MAG: peptidase M48 [Candidatus Melainabacteria bacterium HGW-Melainabacteria-1]
MSNSDQSTQTLEAETRQRIRCRFCLKLNTVFTDDTAEAKSAKPATPACRRCRLPLSAAPHQKWSSVNPDAYIHPLDSQALKALRAIPGVDLIIRKLIGLTLERMYRVLSKAGSVRVSREQYGHLDAKLDVVCQTLNLPKPELYVSLTNDFGGLAINAFTTGAEAPFIVLYSGLVERLDDDELLAVLAHEMGHIHCQHLLYRTAAMALLILLNTALGSTPIGAILKSVSLPIRIALLIWMHKSELSCDRTALLVVQDERVVMSALTKLAGGNLNDELSLDAFIKQAREFDKAYEEDFLDKFWTLVLAAQSSHPFPVWRISEILKWSEDTSPQGYQQLLAQRGRIDPPVTLKD